MREFMQAGIDLVEDTGKVLAELADGFRANGVELQPIRVEKQVTPPPGHRPPGREF